MPRYLAAAVVWISLLAALVVPAFMSGDASSDAVAVAISTTLQSKTSPIAVPIFSERTVVGYVISRVSFTPDSSLSDPSTSPVEAIMRNAFHSIIYRDETFDPATYPNKPITELAEEFRLETNRLFEFEAVKSMSLDYAYYAPVGSPEMNDPSLKKN